MTRSAANTLSNVTHLKLPGVTEQRIRNIVATLQEAKGPLTYAELQDASGSYFDLVLAVTTTLSLFGMVERQHTLNGEPGRPTVTFRWLHGGKARALGVR